jgi:hypothetical protein
MVAVRALLSTLNGIAQAGLLAGSRVWPGEMPGDGGAGAAEDLAEWWDEGAYAHAGDEPLLEDLLRDPVVHLVMRADRLEPAQVRRLLRPTSPSALV